MVSHFIEASVGTVTVVLKYRGGILADTDLKMSVINATLNHRIEKCLMYFMWMGI